jgi:hypothetical protein
LYLCKYNIQVILTRFCKEFIFDLFCLTSSHVELYIPKERRSREFPGKKLGTNMNNSENYRFLLSIFTEKFARNDSFDIFSHLNFCSKEIYMYNRSALFQFISYCDIFCVLEF